MGQPGEIISFQIGNYANFVGAHYYNLQDPELHPEYGSTFHPKTLWRERENAQREKVYTPRVLMFDLKDNWTDRFVQNSGNRPDPRAMAFLGARASGSQSVLDQIQDSISWDGSVQRVVLPTNDISDEDEDSETFPSPSGRRKATDVKKKDKKAKKEPEFKAWGDYAKWRLHSTEKYAFRIPNFMYNAESGKLVSYGQGLDVYHRMEEDVVDGIRLYAEDCDYLEGFHMLVDEYDGFSGIAGGILEHIGDEYDKKATLGLGLNKPLSENTEGVEKLKDYKTRMSNISQLWSSFNRHSRVFSSFGICEDIFTLNPVARKFPGLEYDCNSSYISSSILAATLDSLSAPYRISSPSFPLHEMTSLLNAFGHKMTMFGSSMPFPMNDQTLFTTLNDTGLSSVCSLLPNVELDLDVSLGNLFVVRGIDTERVMSKSEVREYKHADIRNVKDCFELYCQETYSKSVHVIKDIPTPFKSSQPFPRLYEKSYLEAHTNKKRFNLSYGETWLLPAIASAHNSPSVGKILEKIVGVTGGGVGGSTAKMKSFYEPSSFTCNSAVLEFDDYAETINDLDSLRETYSSSS